jgi:bacteriocin biosynthesis cyclodehydratase domain-containing protein
MYYRLARGVDCVRSKRSQDVILRSDSSVVRIEGGISSQFTKHIIALLRRGCHLNILTSKIGGFTQKELKIYLDSLVDSNILIRDKQPQKQPIDSPSSPFLEILRSLGLSLSEVTKKVQSLHVAVFGLEGHGAHLALLLSQCGIGKLTLVDPYPMSRANTGLMPLVGPIPASMSRQRAVARLIRRSGFRTSISLGPEKPLTADSVKNLGQNADFLVAAFDRGLLAAKYWINRLSLETQVPALYTESLGHIALVGPLVLPGKTACYMCFRMRMVACEGNFQTAIVQEEFFAKQKKPALHSRAALPMAQTYIASIASLEVFKVLLGLNLPSLASKALEIDLLTNSTAHHTILMKPDCPVCKKNSATPQLNTTDVLDVGAGAIDWEALPQKLISTRTGIIRYVRQCRKDDSEPSIPFLFSAQLANHIYAESDEFPSGWGKGLGYEDALRGAIAEAVEHYSTWCFDPDIVTSARQIDLGQDAIDPRDLVLHAPEQYQHLPYAPYRNTWVIDWVLAKSLTSDGEQFVPAGAIFMNFPHKDPRKILYHANSNGVAAGSSLTEAVAPPPTLHQY